MGMTVGTHTVRFHEALARAKAKSRKLKRAKLTQCPHCNGSGRMLLPQT